MGAYGGYHHGAYGIKWDLSKGNWLKEDLQYIDSGYGLGSGPIRS